MKARASRLSWLVVCALLAGCTASTGGIYEVEGDWVDSTDALHPLGEDFAFSDIEASRHFGIVALGNNLVLRVHGERPRVILGWKHYLHAFPPHDAFAELNEDTLVFGGALQDVWVAEHRMEEEFAQSDILITLLAREGGSRHVAGPLRPEKSQWASVSFAPAQPGRVYAELAIAAMDRQPLRTLRDGLPEVLNRFFVFDGASWVELPSPRAEGYLAIGSICTDATGALWAAGSVISVDERRTISRERGYAARFADSRWIEVSPPPPREAHVSWSTTRIACGPEGLWLGGRATDEAGKVASWGGDDIPLIYRSVHETWQQVDLPVHTRPLESEAPHRLGLGAFAVDASGRLWVTFWRSPVAGTEPVRMFDGESWAAYPLPVIPGVAQYHVHGIAFDGSGEGWAIANRDGDAVRPEAHGILLRFRDGRWRLQNWKAQFWRRRWLGLLG